MHCRIFRYHRLLIYNIKRNTKIDGIGPFNALLQYEYDINKEVFNNNNNKNKINNLL